MSRGAKPGERRGGRVAGTLNKATIQKALIAERTAADARTQGRKLAKDVLDDLMQIFMGVAAAYQFVPPGAMDKNGNPIPPRGNGAEFEKWARLTVETAKALANYQSPTFRAIVVAPPPEEKGEIRKRFTLTVFEGGRRVENAEIISPIKLKP